MTANTNELDETLDLLEPETIARLHALAADVAETDENVLRELFQTFRRDALERMETLRRANGEGELRNVSATLHSLKGACVTIGMARLATLCRNLETQLQQTGMCFTEKTLDNLNTCVNESVSALENAFAVETD